MANRYFVCERIVGANSLITLEVFHDPMYRLEEAKAFRDEQAARFPRLNFVVQLDGKDVVGYSGAVIG